MGTMADDFKFMHDRNHQVKVSQRDKRTQHLMELIQEGWDIVQLTPNQFCVRGRLDIFPTWAKWHDIKRGRRGEFKGINTKQFIIEWFDEHGQETE